MLADKLQPFLDRYDELSRLLSDPSITSDISNMTKLSKEQRNIEPIKEAANSYIDTLKQIDENKSLLSDPEFGDLAKEELKNLEIQKEKLEEDIKILLLPKDPNDDKNIFLEIRAGTGGDEAALGQSAVAELQLQGPERRGGADNLDISFHRRIIYPRPAGKSSISAQPGARGLDFYRKSYILIDL